MAEDDARIKWMRNVVCGGLSTNQAVFDRMFSGQPGNSIPCQESRVLGKEALEAVLKFLDAETDESLLLIYMTGGASRAQINARALEAAPEPVDNNATEAEPEAAAEPADEAAGEEAAEEEAAPAEAAAEEGAVPAEEAAEEADAEDREEDMGDPMGGEQEYVADQNMQPDSEEDEPAPAAAPQSQAESNEELHVVLGCGSLPESVTDVPTYYFVRRQKQRIDIDDITKALWMGSMAVPSLQVMKLVLSEIYKPILANTNLGQRKVGEKPGSIHGRDTLTNEFLSQLQKFSSQVGATYQQVESDSHIKIPDMELPPLDTIDETSEIVVTLENSIEEWISAILRLIEHEGKRPRPGNGPMAEIEYWQGRNAAFTAMYEQLQSARVQEILEVLRVADSQLLSGFELQMNELKVVYGVAKDNVKFLRTLERHFKNVSLGSLPVIIETLGRLMNALRMVWIISRNLNNDDAMGGILEKVAWEVGQAVVNTIRLPDVLLLKNSEAEELIRTAQAALLKWQSSYDDVRKKIEESGREKRWDFHYTFNLFTDTSYMEQRCQNLLDIVKLSAFFHSVVGPELRAVTGESGTGMEDILKRVEALTQPILSVKFNVFDKKHETSWEVQHNKFRENVRQIDICLRVFIDAAYSKLKSAESAFDLQMKLQTIQGHDTIRNILKGKVPEILNQFDRELDLVIELFERDKGAPPRTKNQPPVAGAIDWSRGLYWRVKKPMLRFVQEKLLENEQGEVIKKKYITLGKAIRDFNNRLYEEFKQSSSKVVMDLLKKPILEWEQKTDKTFFRVAFSHELTIIIQESKYLDRLGFEVPEIALNITLQEPKYLTYVGALTAMVANYKAVIEGIKPAERMLLKKDLDDLYTAIEPGFGTYNWNSLSIQDFVTVCNRAIHELSNAVTALEKNSHMIESSVRFIRRAQLIAPSTVQSEDRIPELQEFVDTVDAEMSNVIDECLQKYRSISQQLGKVEHALCNELSFKNPNLASYYQYWEQRIFKALCYMIISGFKSLNANLSKRPNKFSSETTAMFNVAVSLINPDVVTAPTNDKVKTTLMKLWRNILYTSRRFVRWMDGTCVECKPVTLGQGAGTGIPEDDEEFVYSYCMDVQMDPSVNKIFSIVQRTLQKNMSQVRHSVQGWERYSYLWKRPITKELDTFIKTKGDAGPTVVDYDTRLLSYFTMGQQIQSRSQIKDIGFCRVNFEQIVRQLLYPQPNVPSFCILAWLEAFGLRLKTQAQKQLENFEKMMRGLDSDIRQEEIEEIQDLKFVLETIEHITNKSLDAEIEIRNIQDQYYTLLHSCQGLEISAAEQENVNQLQNRWDSLLHDALHIGAALYPTKRKFAKITQAEASAFHKETESWYLKYQEEGPGGDDMEMDEVVTRMQAFAQEMSHNLKRKEELSNAERLFGMDVTIYEGLSRVEKDMKEIGRVAGFYTQVKEQIDEWSTILWSELELKTLEEGIEEFKKSMRALKDLKELSCYNKVVTMLDAFTESFPLMAMLKGDGLRQRHWNNLMEETGITFDMNPRTFTLGNLFAMHLERFAESIEEISTSAEREIQIEKGLKEIEMSWEVKEFELYKYMRGTEDRGWGLKPVEETNQALDDAAVYLSTMSASKFAAAFQVELKKWTAIISNIAETLDVWMAVQKKWMYLESIFVGSDDIAMQLPEEAKRFEGIDEQYIAIMQESKKAEKLIKCTEEPRIEQLNTLSDSLDACQKGLTEYLETKRNAFPRFFFVSDDDLLAILGSSEPTAVQEHMPKMFDNVYQCKFGKGNETVLALVSNEREELTLGTPPRTDKAVELWMTEIEAEMKTSLADALKSGVYYYAQNTRVEWLYKMIGQVGLAGSQTWWTWEVEDTFKKVSKGDKYGMKKFAAKCNAQLAELVFQTTQPLEQLHGPLARVKINTVIIVEVHSRDIIDQFVIDSVLDPRDFEWESVLRFYWEREADALWIRQCTGQFEYGCEYMGNNGRLVVTGLTDRCYMTLTQALTFLMGGAPAGPAGTGKTETTKDLAKGLGLWCVVTNCGEGLDYKAMGSIFSGLVQCGAWGCFDEFNRIEAAVLSVVATQLTTIQKSLAMKATELLFEGRQIRLDAKCGFFITMNPGYAGRTELPDNVKSLFRPVTMIVPDFRQICEVMLMSEGFQMARILANKMCVLYKLSKEQLSKQHHYDFGMRALKSVLVMAGKLKRDALDKPEDVVLMRALRDMNLPKFIFDDVPLFKGLIADLFPGIDCPRVRYDQFNGAVEDELRARGYQLVDIQIDKVVQMYETMLTRHTSMIVGPTGGGKSVVMQVKSAAQTVLKLPTKMHVLNPKAQTVVELYGFMDPDTREWTDGLLSNIFRDINRIAADKPRHDYIVFDGDVDAVWIENMNSVMDDNKLLTLPNGDRIRLQDHCKMVMEVFDLQYASPATISRCGMVFIDPKDLGWRPYIWSWVNKMEQSMQEIFEPMIDRYCEPLVDFVLEGKHYVAGVMQIGERFKQIIPLTNLNMVKQMTTMIDAAMSGMNEYTEEQLAAVQSMSYESLFVSSCVWSIGASVIPSERPRFDAFLKETLASGYSQDTRTAGRVPAGMLPCKAPTLFEYTFIFDDQEWVPWSDMVTPYVPPADNAFYKILVSTDDTARSDWLLETVSGRAKKPVLFVGESGTAKTVCIQNWLLKQPAATNLSMVINFSSKTSSMDVQKTIEDNIEKRMKGVFGPVAGKELSLFIDDLNMPKVDLYGTQQPIALLKVLIDRSGLYDRAKDLTWFKVQGLQYMSAMGPPGGGRNPVDPRFITLFNTFCVAFPLDDALLKIYSSMLMAHVEPFDDAVKGVAEKMTSCMMGMYTNIVQALPPTPSKFHYIFNLRDLSRVYEGMLRSVPDKVNTQQNFVRLWRNECMRVFHDRLNSDVDRAFVIEELAQAIKTTYAEQAPHALKDPILYGDFLACQFPIVGEGEDEPVKEEIVRLYEDMGTYEDIFPVMTQGLAKYNTSHSSMNLVLFDMALEHMTRIQRSMRTQRGNMLLIGVGGSGKQSNTHLSAYVSDCEVFEISLSRGYGETEFREDLKVLYNKVGAENKPTVFLFTESHLAEEGFLEMVNNMLTVGMVPALFEDDEKSPLINAVTKEATKKGVEGTRDNLWDYFVNRCRDNLHVVLAMSPAGDNLRTYCRNFPGLVNNTTIDWFTPWPPNALQHVANVFLPSEIEGDERKNIVAHMVMVHTSVAKFSAEFLAKLKRYNYVTPKNYLDYIDAYKNGLAENKDRIEKAIKRLDGGLSRLIATAKDVAELDIELKEQKIVLEHKTVEVNAMLVQVQESQVVATEKSKLAVQTELDLQDKSVIIEAQRIEAEGELEQALPILAAAEEALDCVKKSEIDEMKAFKKPKEEIILVAQCVAIMKKRSDIGWASCCQMMGEGSFMTSLKEFDKSQLKDGMMKNVRNLVKKLEGFGVKDPDQLKRISGAASGLMKFVVAIQQYYEVAKVVEPKKRAVQEATRSLAKAMKDLKATQKEVVDLEAQLKQLADALEKTEKEKNELVEKAAKMEAMLIAATKLMAGLESERVRWTADMKGLNEAGSKLVGDCLLSASFVSYTGAFTFDFRARMLYETWMDDILERKVTMTDNFKVTNFLADPVQIGNWNSQGLPADELSIQNGILTERSTRFPLCIDPQLQAVSWIKNKEGEALKVKTFNDDFQKFLEQAVQFGLPFLFENLVEYIDPMIDPILNKNTYMDGGRKMVRLGGEPIEWSDEFVMYMTSKLANPHYGPDVSGKSMLINFSVTIDGLRDQLVNVVVRHEQPALEQQRQSLVLEVAQMRSLLKNLEDTLLRELADATGNILENEDLIKTLEVTKEKAGDTTLKLEQANTTSEQINTVRQGYLPAAERGSILFFSMAGLGQINQMYQYSLGSFLVVFENSLRTSKPDKTLAHRLKWINHKLTRNIYKYTCTGLFQKHTLLYSFHLTVMILDASGEMNGPELDFLLRGQVSLEKEEREKPYKWLSEQGWKDIMRLSKTEEWAENFGTLADDVCKNEGLWRAWYDLDNPEMAEMPMGYSEKLAPLQRMMLLRCFRIDRIFLAVQEYVVQMQGKKYVEPPVLDYKKIFNQTTCTTPVVFILSPGSDPGREVTLLSEEFSIRLRPISMGQGQDVRADKDLAMGIQRGQWVLLMNCHLLWRWLHMKLEKLLEKLDDMSPHKDFRLWITTEPSDKFPLSILQMSLKVVTEPPNGLKLNMRQTYSKIDEAELAACPHKRFRPLVYVLAFFHAVVQERRKYGRIGWNVPYDFNESDFRVSMIIENTYLEKAFHRDGQDGPIPWTTMRYLIGECMYGGRVVDSFDRRVLNTYLDEYMGDFLFDDFNRFEFYGTDDEFYVVPINGSKDVYSNQVENQPRVNTPEVFGLHSNAEIGYFTTASKEIFEQALVLGSGAGGSAGGSKEDEVMEKVAKEILDTAPAIFDTFKIQAEVIAGNDVEQMGGAATPSQVVLFQELDRFNILLNKMLSTLKLLLKALVGEVGMSPELDEVGKALFNAVLPGSWRKKAPATRMNLANWMVHFSKRALQYKKWTISGEPKVMWLSGMHIPETYLAALIQQACRAKRWALDKSALFTKTTKWMTVKEVPKKPEHGAYVSGMCLEGAAWDLQRGCLIKQRPKVLVEEMPIIEIIPAEAAKIKLTNQLNTPVYCTSDRRNAMGVGLVFECNLTTYEHESHWVLQGVAVILNAD